MKLTKTILSASAALALVMGSMGSANAACAVWGKVVYGYNNGAGTSYYYLAQRTALPTVYYYFTTTNSAVKNQMDNAMAGDEAAYAVGNTASCPTTGTARYMGAANVSAASENM